MTSFKEYGGGMVIFAQFRFDIKPHLRVLINNIVDIVKNFSIFQLVIVVTSIVRNTKPHRMSVSMIPIVYFDGARQTAVVRDIVGKIRYIFQGLPRDLGPHRTFTERQRLYFVQVFFEVTRDVQENARHRLDEEVIFRRLRRGFNPLRVVVIEDVSIFWTCSLVF